MLDYTLSLSLSLSRPLTGQLVGMKNSHIPRDSCSHSLPGLCCHRHRLTRYLTGLTWQIPHSVHTKNNIVYFPISPWFRGSPLWLFRVGCNTNFAILKLLLEPNSTSKYPTTLPQCACTNIVVQRLNFLMCVASQECIAMSFSTSYVAILWQPCSAFPYS